jgi:hypothetical protein
MALALNTSMLYVFLVELIKISDKDVRNFWLVFVFFPVSNQMQDLSIICSEF